MRAAVSFAPVLALLLAEGQAAVQAPTPSPVASPAPAGARQVIPVRYTPQSERYQYVPFDVPEGTTRLTVAYAYDKANGGNVVDLGLLEPGSTDLGTTAWRGWSGGARDSIDVGVASASPGYWPGPLPAGRWHVALGLYQVAEAGVDVQVTVETFRDPAGDVPRLPSPPAGPVRRGPQWFSGALHTHTLHSDGALSAAELGRRARTEGLDFLAVTDHNNTAHQLEPNAEPGLLRIAGEEVTTPGGHANVWGLGGWRDVVDFRVSPGDARVAELVREAAARGAVVALNHPRDDSCKACAWTHAVPEGVGAVEVWNAKGAHEGAIALWDELLRAGRRVTGVAASDWHRGELPVGAPSVRVWAPELSQAAILQGIRDGRVILMADARTPAPVVSARVAATVARVGDTLSLIPQESFQVEVAAPAEAFRGGRVDLYWNGRLESSSPITPERTAIFARTASEAGYVRAHVHAVDGRLLAISNPVYVTVVQTR